MSPKIFKIIPKYFELGRAISVISPLILIVILLIIWQTAVFLFNTPSWMLPSPLAITQEIVDSKNILFIFIYFFIFIFFNHFFSIKKIYLKN